MESIIIMGLIGIIICCGIYIVYLGGQYLYDLYMEYFTTESNPDNPDEEPTRKIDSPEFWENVDYILHIGVRMKKKALALLADLRGFLGFGDKRKNPHTYGYRDDTPVRPRYTYRGTGEHRELVDRELEEMKRELGVGMWDSKMKTSKDKPYWTTRGTNNPGPH